jgi:hypothetical protein
MTKQAKKFGHRYPWGEWFANRKTRLKQGRDYPGRTDTMAQAVRFAAKRQGVKVHIEIADDGLSLVITTEKNYASN